MKQAEKILKTIKTKSNKIGQIVISLQNQQLDFSAQEKKKVHKQLEEMQRSAKEIQSLRL